MSGELDGQVAIVTGAGRGFGLAISRHLAGAGAAVLVTARTRSQLEECAALINSAGGTAIPVEGDVTRFADVTRIVDTALQRFGNISLLVNNAGVPGPFGPVGTADPEKWWAAQAVHVYAPLLFMSAVLPGMIRQGQGRIINISAHGGRTVAPGLSAYCVGKAAQIRLTEHVAAEHREHGISAFAMDPGFVVTALAEETMNSPDAQRWLPGMVERLRRRRAEPGAEEDLARCGRRCIALASGRYDALTGQFFQPEDDLDRRLAECAAARH